MSSFDAMKDFFFEGFFSGVPAFLQSEPIIYFVSVMIAVCVAGALWKLCHINS